MMEAILPSPRLIALSLALAIERYFRCNLWNFEKTQKCLKQFITLGL